jgi:hypothetical protein
MHPSGPMGTSGQDWPCDSGLTPFTKYKAARVCITDHAHYLGHKNRVEKPLTLSIVMLLKGE